LGDRDGVRTPMQWSPDRNGGFSRANPQKLILPLITDPEYSYETVNVEVQEQSQSSLLWWMKRALALRKRHPTFARGTLVMLAPENRKVLAFLRRDEAETLLVVVNLARSPQWVELELADYRGIHPLELFGNVEFPAVDESPYRLSIGGHDVFWFSLSGRAYSRSRVPEPSGVNWQPPTLPSTGADPRALFTRGSPLERTLLRYVPQQRWFRGKTRRASALAIVDAVPLGTEHGVALVVIEVGYDDGDPETYALALGIETAESPPALALLGVSPASADKKTEWVVDVSASAEVASALHALGVRQGRVAGRVVELVGVTARESAELVPPASARALGGEQSNSSFRLGTAYVGKFLRKLEEGASLEAEVLEHLARAPEKARVPELVARVEADFGRGARAPVWLSETFIQNEGDAWGVTIDAVQRFFERVLSAHRDTAPDVAGVGLAGEEVTPPPLVAELLGEYLPIAELLGRRTAELHRALAEHGDDQRFRPRVPTSLYKRSYYQSLRNLTARSFDKLARTTLADEAKELAARLHLRQRELRGHFDRYLTSTTSGTVMRVHGDYHLGQVLYTGSDLYIVDFDGEPGRSRAERERLRSPLADVAGMLRSFHYAAFGALSSEISGARMRDQDRPLLLGWAAFHERWSSRAFLKAYLDAMAGSDLLPTTAETFALELDVHLLEKALYELGYELDLRPHWVELPLRGILDVLGPG
ncbi:MAG TPA: alpha-glucosidase C-terminal domain-containing protein, partial [Polyangiaceae bacterium]|nr:alpha-glucosidase C-terminal domain-containing protein [Polyangiaceae bacterium]